MKKTKKESYTNKFWQWFRSQNIFVVFFVIFILLFLGSRVYANYLSKKINNSNTVKRTDEINKPIKSPSAIPKLDQKNSPSIIPDQIDKKYQAVFDINLGKTYYCLESKVEEIERGLKKLDEKLKSDETENHNYSKNCDEKCAKYIDDMENCSNQDCLDLQYTTSMSCTEKCYAEITNLIDKQAEENRALGNQVYTFIEENCDTK